MAKRGVLADTFKIIKSHPKKYLLTLLFDLLLMGALYGISAVFGIGFQGIRGIIVSKGSATFGLLLVLIYFLAIVLAYSFFKFSIIDAIHSIFSKTKTSYRRVWKFFGLNVLLSLIFAVVFVLLSRSVALLPRNTLTYYFSLVVLAAYMIAAYFFLNFSQFKFFFTDKVIDSLKSSLRSLSNIRQYGKLIVYVAVLFVALSILEYIINIPFRLSQGFAIFLTFVNILLGYLVVAFNRIYIYQLVKR